jgi:hypothetical protein
MVSKISLAEVNLFAPFFLFYQGWLKKLLHACITNQARKYYTTGILHNTDEIFHRYLNIHFIKKYINEIMNKKFLSENILPLFYMLLVIL